MLPSFLFVPGKVPGVEQEHGQGGKGDSPAQADAVRLIDKSMVTVPAGQRTAIRPSSTRRISVSCPST